MKKLIQKILKIRKHLLVSKKGYRNELKCYTIVDRLENHLKCYPNISDQALVKYTKKHLDEIIFLIPGNSTGDSLKQQLFKLL